MSSLDVLYLHHDALNNHETEHADQFVADDALIIDAPAGEQYTGVQGYRQFAQQWLNAFPDLSVSQVEQADYGNRIHTTVVLEGNFKHDLQRGEETTTATGSRLVLRWFEEADVENGKIQRLHINYNEAEMMREFDKGVGPD